MHLALLFATGASRTSTDFCRLSPTPTVHLKSSRCVYVRRACFDAEQIILHGRDAADSKKAIDSVLNGLKDPYSTFAMLRPWSRNITLVAQPGASYSYLFDAQINNSNAFATPGFTSLVRAGPSAFVLIYQKYFSPSSWPPFPLSTFQMKVSVSM